MSVRRRKKEKKWGKIIFIVLLYFNILLPFQIILEKYNNNNNVTLIGNDYIKNAWGSESTENMIRRRKTLHLSSYTFLSLASRITVHTKTLMNECVSCEVVWRSLNCAYFTIYTDTYIYANKILFSIKRGIIIFFSE